jgi:6-phosphogluconolactonase/glucosamine-6-phosphate isomerase/deaminase
MTLTASVVNGATHIVWLVTGAAKQPVLRHLLDGSAAIPAAAVRRDPNVVVVADRAAVTLP